MLTSMEIKGLHEAGGRIKPREDLGGDKYVVRLMGWDEGESIVHGSSADYPVNVIKRDFPESFPAGTRMRANHDGFCEDGGDITRIVAKTLDTPWAEKDGMYATAYVSENYTTLMREFAEVIGTSISAAGELDPRNDPEHEQFDPEFPKTVTRFYTAEESPYNSVDFVEAPGADGRVIRAVESAAKEIFAEGRFNIREQTKFVGKRVEEKSPKAVPPKANEGKKMDPEEETALVERVASAAVAKAVEALRPAPEEVRMENVAEAAIEAGLSKEGREGVYERVEAGMPVAEAIEKEKSREAAIEARVKATIESEAKAKAPSYTTFGESAAADYTADELAGE